MAKTIGYVVIGAMVALWAAGAVRPKEEKMEIRTPVQKKPEVGMAKSISPTETLRIITMPSEIEYFGTRCLLYRGSDSGHVVIVCARKGDFIPDKDGPH